ncbi:MAG: 2,3-bisphosphoglycerate-independent phosphoglycerate mutase [Pseudomonadota bacterium]
MSPTPPRPVILCILDGWGLREEVADNAVALAETPNFDRVMATCPSAQLVAHGPAVGLPEGQMGNSEVGHTNIGAGRVVWMDLPKIDNAIADGSFATNPALGEFIATLRESGGTAHLAGLASPGGVHAHQRHIAEAARVIAAAGVPVAIHAFTDGRDVAPTSAAEQLAALEADLPEGARIATVIGRFFAMDRDTRWDRVSRAYELMRNGSGSSFATATDAVAAAYNDDITDEFIEPAVIDGYGGMADGDGLLFLNFRADRAREILSAFLDPAFGGFARETVDLAAACGMVEYSDAHNGWMDVMFPAEDIPNTLGAWVAAQGKAQFRIAETEKYPHVTFFLNGGVEVPNPGEDRMMPKSPNVKTYDLQPEMSAGEVTARLVSAIGSGTYDLIVVNYANPDMVGHTGDLSAAMAACAAVDAGLGEVLAAVDTAGGAMILTADHGNCEVMRDPVTGGPHTAHTLNPVPVALIGGPQGVALQSGKLADLAPTLLTLMGLPQPPEMTGASLIVTP